MERLPAGQDRFQAELLSRTQRDRILDAMAGIVAKRGYQGTTVERIVKRAGVARVTFYENFENREACMLACFDAAVQAITRRAVAAAEAEDSWPDQMRAGLAACLDYVVANPAIARSVVVETMTAGPAAMQRYEQALRSFTPAIALGRKFGSAAGELPDTLEDSIAGGIVWMVHQRLLHAEVDQIPDLLPTMLEFALSPYLGERRAAEVASEA
jgi:AcrR family transcriptional regulator